MVRTGPASVAPGVQNNHSISTQTEKKILNGQILHPLILTKELTLNISVQQCVSEMRLGEVRPKNIQK